MGVIKEGALTEAGSIIGTLTVLIRSHWSDHIHTEEVGHDC